ncbi:MAG: hypothetical protein JSS66_01120 [Armatimonadetes bacterium]|nr:hypothetical protein [Armatimonadota bacterium]
MATFREVQDARDVATVLTGVGGLLLLASAMMGLFGVLNGFGFWVSWMSFWLGPILALAGILLLVPGLLIQRVKRGLESELH